GAPLASSARIAPPLLVRAATCSGVSPLRSAMPGSAPASSSTWYWSARGESRACTSGVVPVCGLRALASPPCSSTSRSSSGLPENAAAWTAVSPRGPARLGSAPPCSSASTLACWPLAIAASSRVLPSLPGASTSRCPGWRRISAASPRATASDSGESSGLEKASLLMDGRAHPAARHRRKADAIAVGRRMRGIGAPIIAPRKRSRSGRGTWRLSAEEAADEAGRTLGEIGHALRHPAGAVGNGLDGLAADIGHELDRVAATVDRARQHVADPAVDLFVDLRGQGVGVAVHGIADRVERAFGKVAGQAHAALHEAAIGELLGLDRV